MSNSNSSGSGSSGSLCRSSTTTTTTKSPPTTSTTTSSKSGGASLLIPCQTVDEFMVRYDLPEALVTKLAGLTLDGVRLVSRSSSTSTSNKHTLTFTEQATLEVAVRHEQAIVTHWNGSKRPYVAHNEDIGVFLTNLGVEAEMHCLVEMHFSKVSELMTGLDHHFEDSLLFLPHIYRNRIKAACALEKQLRVYTTSTHHYHTRRRRRLSLHCCNDVVVLVYRRLQGTSSHARPQLQQGHQSDNNLLPNSKLPSPSSTLRRPPQLQ